MNIDYTVTALMFPAIPLLMSVYSNRFHSLSMLIRELHDEHVYENHIPHEWKKQFINLKWTDHTYYVGQSCLQLLDFCSIC